MSLADRMHRSLGLLLTVVVFAVPETVSISPQPASSLLDNGRVRTGADVITSDSLHLLRGKTVGLVCNQTAVLGDGRHLIDVLVDDENSTLAAIFTPEHGLDGWSSAGVEIPSSIYHGDTVTASQSVSGHSSAQGKIPIHSLYGKTRKPSAEMLAGLDVLLFDMQDVGARFYTYISTMVLCMEAAAQHGIPFLILDRPNPLGGIEVEGPIITDSLRSFVGLLPIPVRHGLTIGELALMTVGEDWMNFSRNPNVRVIPMQGWNRAQYFVDTGLEWIRPSPNMPDPQTAILYPGTCLIEGSNVSEGRGTERPFLTLGAPFIDGPALAEEIRNRNLPGIRVAAITFIPESRAGAVTPRFQDEECSGIELRIEDHLRIRPFRTGLEIMAALVHLYGDEVRITAYFDLLTGFAPIRNLLLSGQNMETLTAIWSDDERAFIDRRKKYLMYP